MEGSCTGKEGEQTNSTPLAPLPLQDASPGVRGRVCPLWGARSAQDSFSLLTEAIGCDPAAPGRLCSCDFSEQDFL